MSRGRKLFPRFGFLVLVIGLAIAVLTSLDINSFTVYAAVEPPIGGELDTTSPVLFIHGFHFPDPAAQAPATYGSADGYDCGGAWEQATNYLKKPLTYGIGHVPLNWDAQSLVTIGYYAKDSNCSYNLSQYKDHCTNTYDGSESDGLPDDSGKSFEIAAVGTNNESISHVGCELAWLIYDKYTSHNQFVRVVAHSMGGLIVRWAIYATQQHQLKQHPSALTQFPIMDFPPLPLSVSDVVTFDTPHGGIPTGVSASGLFCGGCVQGGEMSSASPFMNAIVAAQGHDLHTSGSPNWTLMGIAAPCALDIVNASTSMYMEGTHKFLFLSPCLDHGGIISDLKAPPYVFRTSGKGPHLTLSNCSTRLHPTTLPKLDIDDGYLNDAIILRGDNTPKDSQPGDWDCVSNAPHPLKIMLLALLQQDW